MTTTRDHRSDTPADGGSAAGTGGDAADAEPANWWHTTVQPGRMTAVLDRPLVVFLIGARINKLLAVRSWLWVARAMPAMMDALARRPELGLRHVENFSRGRTTLSLQYWESMDHLMAFATDQDNPHLEAWRRWNRQMRASDDVGIWHETYVVTPGAWEGMYVNMPPFGMGAALGDVPVGGSRTRAAQRMAAA